MWRNAVAGAAFAVRLAEVARPSGPMREMNILIVDDNPDDRILAARELQKAFPGAAVQEVADESAMAAALLAAPPDLVVTDYQINWTDGIAVVKAVRARWPGVPVIMFTGSGSEEVAVAAMKAGLDDYVIKSPKHYVRLGTAAAAVVKRAASERRAALLEGRLHRLLNRLSVGVCRMTPAGEIIECNPAFLRICGVATADELTRVDLGPLVLPESERRRLEAAGLDVHDYAQWGASIVRAGRDVVHLLVNATLSTCERGTVVDYLVEDETDRRRVMQNLESANRAKDHFLAALSHELRTPLMPILNVAGFLERDESLPEHVREDIAILRRNAEMEARLIDDLLDLSRITHGKVHFEWGEVPLHDVVRQAVATCCPDPADRARIGVDLRASNDTVRGDAARLQQVFVNLVGNAVKFTPRPGKVTVTTRNPSDGNATAGWIEVEVRDTGIGIEKDMMGRLFNAFEQEGRPGSGTRGGLGLGLSIAKRLVELHGGTVTAHSDGRDRGTTLTVRLPVLARVTPGAVDGSSDGRANGNGAADRGMRILLVEDHPDTSRLLARLLARSGHAVTTAASVGEAVRIGSTGAFNFDLLISDIGLPDGDGVEVYERLSAAAGRRIKAVALSGFGMDGDVERSMRAGFTEHITKPITFDALEAVIQRVTKS